MAHYDFTQIDLRQLAQTLLGEGKRSGRAVLFHSPLRPGDDHPSFAVYANGFKDFGGSGDHGDCIDFVEIVLQCNRAAAIEYLIQVSGGKAPSRPIFTPLPTPLSEHEPPSADWQAAARSAADKAAAYLWSDRPDARRVLDYLRHVRHLNDETIRTAGLGFNPSWCKTTWLNPDTRKKAQLPPGITLPYHSDGVLWAIRVRSIVGSFAAHLHQRDQQIGGKPAPKYLNLTGSHASGVLYNADQVTPGAPLLLVEGEFDALLASQELSANGVTFGAASTAPAVIPSRWRSVFTSASQVYLTLDSDAAGQAGADRLAKALPEALRLPLPEGVKDVTELVQHGGDLRQWFPQRAPDPRAEAPQPVEVDQTARLNLPFISDMALDALPPSGAVLVKSDMGTGKTRLAARFIDRAEQQHQRSPRVLVISHRQALTADLVNRLNREGMNFESYKGLDAVDLRRIDQLGIVVNSLPKLRASGEGSATIPVYDVVIIDEIEQVLAHLNGETFRKSEALITHALLKSIVAATELVVGMDAHAGVISQTWLENVRGSTPTVIENRFTPTRGALIMHADETTVITQADTLIEENAGVVVMPTNSRMTARKLHKRYTDKYGKSAVVMIWQDNSESSEIQDFIAHIDERLQKLRVFIYSPSLGSGVDIQTPVRAVCALFNAVPLAASELHQLLGRARHPQETHVYVQTRRGNDETNVETIYQRHLYNAIKTGQVCEFDAHGVIAVNETQRGFLRLCAMSEAARARSMNDLRTDFLALARGYTLSERDGKDDGLKKELRELREALAADDKTAVLEAKAVDYEELERLRTAGEVTPEIRAGHDKFKIEETVGAPLSSELYDQFHTPEQREELRAFTDLLDEPEALKQGDREQAADGVPLNKRTHRLTRRLLLKRLITDVFGELGLDSREELTEEEIEQRMTDYLTLHRHDLRHHFGHRADHSQDPVAVLRWLLGKIGVRLVSRQLMRERKRFRVYSIDPSSVVKMRQYAETRMAYLLEKRAQKGIAQNLYKDKRAGSEKSAASLPERVAEQVRTALDECLDVLLPPRKTWGYA